MRKVLGAAWNGISIACAVFVLFCIIFGLANGTEKFASGYGMVRMGLRVLLIGLGFGLPSCIYETKLSWGLKVLIHMGTGCAVMIAASVWGGGWINSEMGWPLIALILLMQVGSAFAIWGGQVLHARALARRMNEKIAQKNPQADE